MITSIQNDSSKWEVPRMPDPEGSDESRRFGLPVDQFSSKRGPNLPPHIEDFHERIAF